MRDIILAAVGDVHGAMYTMIVRIQALAQATGCEPDLVLQVGDFEPARDARDLESMDAPAKYRKLGDFPGFYHGRARFPWPVLFIGGNHEPYGYLDQFPEGGELVENCTYLGRAGQVERCGLRISGISGVYNDTAFNNQVPRDQQNWKQRTYLAGQDLDRLLELPRPDILLMHDWPYGLNCPDQNGRFAGRGCADVVRPLVDTLEPPLVLCGHQHHGYTTTLQHKGGGSSTICCLSDIQEGPGSVALFRYSRQSGFTQINP